MFSVSQSKIVTAQTFVYNSILLTGLKFNCIVRVFLCVTGSSQTPMFFEIVYKSLYWKFLSQSFKDVHPQSHKYSRGRYNHLYTLVASTEIYPLRTSGYIV